MEFSEKEGRAVNIVTPINFSETPLPSTDGSIDYIIAPRELSRLGRMTLEQAIQKAQEVKDNGHRAFLQWDAFFVEQDLAPLLDKLCDFPFDHFDGVRVADPGALNFLLENFPKVPIHFVAEMGNHNIEALKGWCELIGEQLSRLVLSIELPSQKLAQYIDELPVQVEFMALGPILLFYSPRKLVSHAFSDIEDDTDEEWKEVMANSEESAHKGFKVFENSHGTFMFNPKIFCLLEQWDELKEMGLDYARVELGDKSELLHEIQQLNQNFDKSKASEIKESFGQKAIRGFYHVNRSDVLFPKLKNARRSRSDQNYLGEVVEVSKGKYIAIYIRNHDHGVELGSNIKILTPDGKEKHVSLNKISDVGGQSLNKIVGQNVILIPSIGGVSVRSTVFMQNQPE